MAKNFFVLGIGGTGMRCIESLIHLCAMGMFDDTDVHLLALDTDKDNGNFNRLRQLKEAYQGVKGLPVKEQTALKDTFFSANINYYEFSPNYEKSCTFKDVYDYGNAEVKHKEIKDLADLVFTKEVEEFNLRHGYRAQTHLGSLMMYHSILEAAKEERENGLKKFLDKLGTVCEDGGNPRIFILGSVFGGTGASSIPVIPKALADAMKTLRPNTSLSESAFFGSTLLSSYFTFKVPSDSEVSNQKIVATSDKFALNSQAAMMFYNDDSTVRKTYQRFYLLGTPEIRWNVQKNETSTVTGGREQENDSHYIELQAACAAWDFFQASDGELLDAKNSAVPDYLYRSLDDTEILEFQDFTNKNTAKEFGKKMGLLFVFSLINNTQDDFFAAMQAGKQGMNDFEDIPVEQVGSLKRYFEFFHVKINDDGSLEDGWLRQLYRSAGQGDKFLFNSEMFTANNYSELYKTHWSDKLYKPTSVCKDNGYSAKTVFGYKESKRWDQFMDIFIDVHKSSKQKCRNLGEQLIQEIYITLTKLYKFNR